MRHPRVARAPLAALAGALLAVSATAGPASAHTLRVRDEGRLHYLRSSGEAILDEGAVHGTLSGTGRVRFVYNGSPTVSATFTISGRGWSVSGRGSGRLHNPYSTAPSFRGRLTITRGTGRYSHANGTGELFGVFDRRNYSLIFQAIGTLRW
jgi:hypothetical protein